MQEGDEGLRLPRTRRRQQVLAAAAQAFAETGFHGTSRADVATRVGVSQPGLLHPHPDEQALILAVLEERDGEDSRQPDEAFRDEDPSVVTWLTALCALNAERPDIVRLCAVPAAEGLDPPVNVRALLGGFLQRLGATGAGASVGSDGARADG